ncbi:MAG: flagellar hook-length control protein FliK [Desulfobacteraceae bacterium]|nr:flagellar hook-length control protein FliK [Desulfobacteraceae bacterium]
MIFSAQGLLDAKTCISSDAAGESGKKSAAAKSDGSGQGRQDSDFLNLLAQIACTESEKGGIKPGSGNEETSPSRAQIEKQLLDLLKSNYPADMFKSDNKTEDGSFYACIFPGLQESDILQEQEFGIADLLEAVALKLQSEKKDVDALSDDGATEGSLKRLLSLMSAKGEQNMDAAGGSSFSQQIVRLFEVLNNNMAVSSDITNRSDGLNEVETTGTQRHLRDLFSGMEASKGDSGGGGKVSQSVPKILEAFNSPSMTADTANRVDSSKSGGPADAREQLRALFSGMEVKEGEVARGRNFSQSASEISDILNSRSITADTARGAEGSKDGGETDAAAGRLQALLSASGDKGTQAAKKILSVLKESPQDPAQSAELGKQALKNLSSDKAGRETLDIARVLTVGGEKSINPATPVRQANTGFDRQLQAAESRIISQVSVRLSAGVQNGFKNMTVQMYPPELGRVKVRIISDKNGLNVHLQSQNQQVAGVLERHLPGLQQSLTEQGVSVANLQVSVGSGGGQGESQFEDHGFGDSNRHTPAGKSAGEDEMPAAAEPEPVTPAAGHGQGLSLRV